MIFLDTSYFVALARPSDALHSIATQWSSVVSGPFVTTEFVLLEFVNMLSSALQRGRAHAVLATLQGSKHIRVVPASSQWFSRGLSLHAARADKTWSLTDCISFELMREERLTDALTADRDFEQAGFRALMRNSPT